MTKAAICVTGGFGFGTLAEISGRLYTYGRQLGCGGRDLDPVLLGGGGEETPYAVRLPRCGMHYLRQRRSLRSPDQFQDLGSFALRPGLLVRRRRPLLGRLGSGPG